MESALEFLRTYESEIGSAAMILATVAATVGAVAAIIGIGFTAFQIRQAARALRASNTYQIQKDIRELIDRLKKDPDFNHIVRQGLAGAERSEREKFVDNLWSMLNLYVAIFRQHQSGGITREFSNRIGYDLKQFLSLPAVCEGWTHLEDSGRIGKIHEDMRKEWA